MIKVLVAFGTRPEAIKMAPLCIELSKRKEVELVVCSTGQHLEMLEQVLEVFAITPDVKIDVMQKDQSLSTLSSNLLLKFEKVLTEVKPDLVLVHGDTTTSFICALSAYYQQIKIGHIEAGLRTFNIRSPWPEEANRCFNKVIANYHFAPTTKAMANLIKENVDKAAITITGNTGIDAIKLIVNKLNTNKNLQQHCNSILPKNLKDKLLLVTGHRRENFENGLKNICESLKQISENNKDLSIIYPVHLNPNVQKPVYEILTGIDNIHLIKPVDYLQFVNLMTISAIILTDSGGIQEEAPTLKKPVLVMRDNSERPEVIDLNLAKLVGTNIKTITSTVQKLLDDKDFYKSMQSNSNPYGDGKASQYIADAIINGQLTIDK